MSLLNIPTQESVAIAQQQQLDSVNTKQPSAVDTNESRNLEFIGKSVGLVVQDVYKGVNLLSGGVGAALGANEWAENAFNVIDKPDWLQRPKADEISKAGEITGEVLRSLTPFLLPVIGLGAGATTMASRTGIDLVNQGVDGTTAGKAAAASGLSAVAMAGLGEIVGSGKTVLGTIGRQTAANIPTGMASRAIEQSVLADKYPEIADRVKILGAEEVGLDIALGLLLGGLSHKRVTKGVMDATGKGEAEASNLVAKAEEVIASDVKVDDAVRVKQVQEFAKDSNPIAEPDSYDLHMTAMDKAITDIDNLKPVDVSELITPEMIKGDLPVMDLPAKQPGINLASIEHTPKDSYLLDEVALKSIKERIATSEAAQDVMPDLKDVSLHVYENGAQTPKSFVENLKAMLGESWERFKGYAADLWKFAKRIFADERGLVGVDINAVDNDQTAKLNTAQTAAASMSDDMLRSGMIVRIERQLEGALSREEIAQVIGTVETRYKYLKTRLTQDQVDIQDEFARLGIEKFSKAKTAEYLAMTPEERVTALTKAELQKTLEAKKESIRRQQQSARRLEARRDDLDALQLNDPDRTRIQALTDYLVGDAAGKGNVQNLQAIAKGLTVEMMQPLIKPLRPFMDAVFGVRMDADQYRNLVHELIKPGSTKDADVANLARAISEVNDTLRIRLNKAGADIGMVDGYIPQAWARTKTMFAGLTNMEKGKLASGIGLTRAEKVQLTEKARKSWVDNMMQLVKRDHAAYIDKTTGEYFSDAQMREFLGNAFDTLATDGANKGQGGGGKGSLASRLSSERSLFFKDANSYMKANELYGASDVMTTMVSHIQKRAKDLALLENMDAQNFEALLAEAKQADGKTSGGMFSGLHRLEAIWMELSGSRQSTGTGLLSDAFGAARNWQVFTKLGSALLSQPSDIATFGLMAAKDGLGIAPAIREIASALKPGNKADRIAAEDLGLAIESIYEDAGSRFMDATNDKSVTSKLAQFTIKAGFMKWWTDSMKRGFHVLVARGIARKRGTAYAHLDSGFKYMLERNGIDAPMWDAIRQTKPVDFNGRQIIAPSMVADDVARSRLFAMFADEADYGVIEPGARERAWMLGTQETGSVKGEIWKSFALFKMFSVTMLTKVMPRLFTNLEGNNLKFAGHMAAYALSLVGLGAFSMQLKELSKGRNPRDMKDAKFWIGAAGQSGGLGIFSDFIFGDVNRMGQNVATTLAGPLAATATDMIKLTAGNVQELAQGKPTKATAETLQFIKNNAVPNLWYTKQALDTLLFNRAQEAVNPGYLSRMKRRVERENNTSFWWRPGDLLPSSPPDINSAWRN